MGYKYSSSSPGELNVKLMKIVLVPCQAMNKDNP